MFPRLWIVERFGHQICHLLFGVYVQHVDSWMCADFEEPLHVDPVSPWQVAERHASRLLDDLDDSLIVFGDHEDCRMPLLPGVREVLSRIEAVGVWVHLEC